MDADPHVPPHSHPAATETSPVIVNEYVFRGLVTSPEYPENELHASQVAVMVTVVPESFTRAGVIVHEERLPPHPPVVSIVHDGIKRAVEVTVESPVTEMISVSRVRSVPPGHDNR